LVQVVVELAAAASRVAEESTFLPYQYVLIFAPRGEGGDGQRAGGEGGAALQSTVRAWMERQHVRQLKPATGTVQQFGPTGAMGCPVKARGSEGSIRYSPLGSGVTSLNTLGAPGSGRWQ